MNSVKVLTFNLSIKLYIAVSRSKMNLLVYWKLYSDKGPILIHLLPLKTLSYKKQLVKRHKGYRSMSKLTKGGVDCKTISQSFRVTIFAMPLL